MTRSERLYAALAATEGDVDAVTDQALSEAGATREELRAFADEIGRLIEGLRDPGGSPEAIDTFLEELDSLNTGGYPT